MPGSPKWSLSLKYPHQYPVYASPLPRTRYMTRSILDCLLMPTCRPLNTTADRNPAVLSSIKYDTKSPQPLALKVNILKCSASG